MEKSELARICGISRQSVYNLMSVGMSEEDILSKYTIIVDGIRVQKYPKTSKDRFNEGYQTGYKEGYQLGYKDGYEEISKMIGADSEKAVKENQKVKELVKKIVYKYQLSTNKEVEFADINEIYEMIKEY